ncbi:MAG: hypothetical protein ABJB49_10655 [Nitrospirota bacterium]
MTKNPGSSVAIRERDNWQRPRDDHAAPDFAVTLDLETAYANNLGHRTSIISDWPPLTISETSQWSARNGAARRYVRARHTIGNRRGVIRVQTVNGDVVIGRGR